MDTGDRSRAVSRFQKYLQIKSAHPNPDYKSVVDFFDDYAEELRLDAKHVLIGQERKVVVVICLPGKDKSLPSVLLNSHTDVVPAFAKLWKHDPFGGYKDDNGNIYGRGAQDMKSVGIQYLEAIRRLTKNGKAGDPIFKRTVYVSFMPDEEINGGDIGMKLFMETSQFSEMNIGLALDEGLANPDNKYSVYYGERSPWWVKVKCTGNTGHGSRFIANTAAEKLRKLINSVADFRSEEESKLKGDSCLYLGDVTTANLTMIRGGDIGQPNVIPEECSAVFDIRIPPSVDLVKFEETFAGWCNDAGKNITYEFLEKNTNQEVTKMDDSNPWWVIFAETLKAAGVHFVKEIFPAATDGRFLREAGYQVIGFSPMRNTPILLHDNDEYVNEEVFLEGIEIYCKLISAFADSP